MEDNFTEVGNIKHSPPKAIHDNTSIGLHSEYQGILASSNQWIELACSIASNSVSHRGGPFGAVILQIDEASDNIIRYWTASNAVVENVDPTAHAEIEVIRKVCQSLGVFNLRKILAEESKLSQPSNQSYCVIYSSCEPCPMCYSAISWARIPVLYFAADRYDAAQPGVDFSDLEFYNELEKPYKLRSLEVYKCSAPNAVEAFQKWKQSNNIGY